MTGQPSTARCPRLWGPSHSLVSASFTLRRRLDPAREGRVPTHCGHGRLRLEGPLWINKLPFPLTGPVAGPVASDGAYAARPPHNALRRISDGDAKPLTSGTTCAPGPTRSPPMRTVRPSKSGEASHAMVCAERQRPRNHPLDLGRRAYRDNLNLWVL